MDSYRASGSDRFGHSYRVSWDFEWFEQQVLDLFEPRAVRAFWRTACACVFEQPRKLIEHHFFQRSWFNVTSTAAFVWTGRRAR